MKNTISVKSHFEEDIKNLWNNPKYSNIEVKKRGYVVHDKIIQNSILFVGINPSFAKGLENESYFINLCQEGRDRPGGGVYSYFKKFVRISKEVGLVWSHIDLLFFRETSQRFVDSLIKNKENGQDFISDQLKISKNILIKAQPKIIVVSNTKARDFMRYKKERTPVGFDFEFNEELGTEVIVNDNELNGTPVFFTSMLTGQRALDNGSFKRLTWHIKFVLKKLNNKS